MTIGVMGHRLMGEFNLQLQHTNTDTPEVVASVEKESCTQIIVLVSMG